MGSPVMLSILLTVRVGVFDAHGEEDQAGLKAAAEVYLTALPEFPGHWDALNN